MFQLIRTLSASHLLARQLPVAGVAFLTATLFYKFGNFRAGVRGLPGHLVRAGRDRAGRRAPVRAGGAGRRAPDLRLTDLRLTQRPSAVRPCAVRPSAVRPVAVSRNPGSAASASGGIVWPPMNGAEVDPQAGRRQGVADHLRASYGSTGSMRPCVCSTGLPASARACRPQRASSSGAPDSRQSPAQAAPTGTRTRRPPSPPARSRPAPPAPAPAPAAPRTP